MSDLIKRLRSDAEWNSAPQVDLDLPVTANLERESADRIEQLEAENAALKRLLQECRQSIDGTPMSMRSRGDARILISIDAAMNKEAKP